MATARLKRNIWFAVMGLLVAGIAAGTVFFLSQTELLAVDSIVIEGNRVVSTEEISGKIDPLLQGQSILKPSFDDVSQALSEYPYIESVEIDRDLPHTIVVHVREYRSFVTLAAAESKYVVLSSENRALVQVPAPARDFPLLKTKDPCAVETGRQVECADVMTGNEFLNNIPTNFNQDIVEVMVADGDITIRTGSGVSIHFGTLEDFELKFEVMRQLMARSAAAGESLSIDVSVVERPVTRGSTVSTAATTSTQAAGNAEEAAAAEEAATANGDAAMGDGAATADPNADVTGATGPAGDATGGAGAETAVPPATDDGTGAGTGAGNG